MSSVKILDAGAAADSSQQVSRGYMGCLYLLVGAGFLFDILTRIFCRDGQDGQHRESMIIISFVVITFLISLTGFIMSCFKRVTSNRGKLIFIFVCFFVAAIGALIELSLQDSNKTRAVMYNSFGGLFAQVFGRIPELLAILAAGIQVLFLSCANKNHPQIPLLSKLVVSCSAILSCAINIGMYKVDIESPFWLVCFSTMIGCAALVALGTVWGINCYFKNIQQQTVDKAALESAV